MCQYTITARSKLKNFAPKISSCAQVVVLSVRNANIVSYGYAVRYVRQGFDKNLSPQSACAFRAFGNSFMSYMVLWEQVLTTIYAINEWEAVASLEKHKRKKQRKTQGYKILWLTRHTVGAAGILALLFIDFCLSSYFWLYFLCNLVFLYVFPLMVVAAWLRRDAIAS